MRYGSSRSLTRSRASSAVPSQRESIPIGRTLVASADPASQGSSFSSARAVRYGDRMGRLEGKVAIVAGGASGIGAATMRRFAAEGAAVVCADLDDAGAASLVAEIEASGGRAAAQRADVGVLADLEAVVALAVKRFGGLDVMHNNAVWSGGGYVHEIDPDVWDRSMQVALTGVFYGQPGG